MKLSSVLSAVPLNHSKPRPAFASCQPSSGPLIFKEGPDTGRASPRWGTHLKISLTPALRQLFITLKV